MNDVTEGLFLMWKGKEFKEETVFKISTHKTTGSVKFCRVTAGCYIISVVLLIH